MSTHFPDDGLLFRHSCTVGILAGATDVNYPTSLQISHGIGVLTVRRIYGHDDTSQKIPEPVLASIDITQLRSR